MIAVALAAIGACFGALAIAFVLAVLPRFMEADKELLQAKLEILQLRKDFAQGLAELQATYDGAGERETGVWMPRLDPVTGREQYVKAVENEPKPSNLSVLAQMDLHNIEDIVRQHERAPIHG